MRRLFWVGVGVVVTVVVIRKGREIALAYLPEGTGDVVERATRIGGALATARREFAAGMAEREAQLTHDLVGDADIDALRERRGEHVDALREAWAGSRPRKERARKVPDNWAGPTEDPDDDADAPFF